MNDSGSGGMTEEKNSTKTKGFSINEGRWWLHEDLDARDNVEEFRIKPPTVVESLESQLAEKDRLLKDYIKAHKSSVADLDDARVRIEKELERRLEIEKARAIEPFLEISDNLKRLASACTAENAMDEIQKGMELILLQIEDGFRRIGVRKIPTDGLRFDPKYMEALMTGDVDADQDGMVLEEVREGFALGDHVVRPAGVRVGVKQNQT